MTLETLFSVSAVVGGAFFLVQLALQIFGGGGGADADLDLGADVPHGSTDFSFKVLSLQGLSAFFLMFGLVGLATLRADFARSPVTEIVATGVGLVGGFATTWVIARVFEFASRLQSSGTVDLPRFSGAIGTVTLDVGPGKTGKVNLSLGNKMMEVEAISADDTKLPTGTLVKVVRLVNHRLVSVQAHRDGDA